MYWPVYKCCSAPGPDIVLVHCTPSVVSCMCKVTSIILVSGPLNGLARVGR